MPFVAAVSLDEKGHPRHLKLNMVSGFTSQAIATWAKANLAPGACVTSDGLGCFAAVVDAGCIHQPEVVGALKPRDLPNFRWVNTVLGNLKTSLAGTFHSLNFRKYAQHYLGAFAYRFNRRFRLHDMAPRLAHALMACKPCPEPTLRLACNFLH